MVHVKYEGRSDDIDFPVLFPAERLAGLGIAEGTQPTPQTVTERQVKLALAQHYDRGANEFDQFYVEINPNGNITVRPDATFGL